MPQPSRPPLTHFLSIPLLTASSKPRLKASLTHFKKTVTALSCPELPSGIPAQAIRPLGTLHLTLGVMSLTTPERIQEALGVLRGADMKAMLREAVARNDAKKGGKTSSDPVKSDVDVDPESLMLSLQGLDSMHEQSDTSVLYITPYDSTQRLQPFCERLRDLFLNAGLMIKEDRPLLLHATIVNTIYVKGERSRGGERGGRGGHGRNRARSRLDARKVLEMFGDFEWVRDFKVDRVAICRMGAKRVEGVNDEDDDEAYIVEDMVMMPT